MKNYCAINGKPVRWHVISCMHFVSVDEMPMAAAIGKFFLSLEIYKPAM